MDASTWLSEKENLVTRELLFRYRLCYDLALATIAPVTSLGQTSHPSGPRRDSAWIPIEAHVSSEIPAIAPRLRKLIPGTARDCLALA